MLKIRLQRTGRKRMAVFRLVIAENTMPVNGKYIEKLGSFVAGKKEQSLSLNSERIIHWLAVGAQPTETVASLCLKQGIKEMEKFIKPRKTLPTKAEQKIIDEKKNAKKAT